MGARDSFWSVLTFQPSHAETGWSHLPWDFEIVSSSSLSYFPHFLSSLFWELFHNAHPIQSLLLGNLTEKIQLSWYPFSLNSNSNLWLEQDFHQITEHHNVLCHIAWLLFTPVRLWSLWECLEPYLISTVFTFAVLPCIYIQKDLGALQ